MTPGQTSAGARPEGRCLQRIVATTDVHSVLDHASLLVSQLHALQGEALIADCGDFFEGTGYYVLGGGQAETALLTALYDVVAPGNHGYRHHLDDAALHAMTVCANVTGQSGTPVFAPLAAFEIGGATVAVAGVLGIEAFISIPPAERTNHKIVDPAFALRALHRKHLGGVDSWIVLSHAGFAHDLALARACPFLDVVFSGHCHSPESGPVTVGGVTVVKGPELAAGYATARPGGCQWRAATTTFLPPDAQVAPPDGLRPVLDQVADLRGELDEPVGTLDRRFAGRTPPRRELLSHLARAAREVTGADVAVFNQTCLRETTLGPVLHVGELMALEPFGNTLICVQATDPTALVEHLIVAAGPLVCDPQPFPRLPHGRAVTVVTTDYLATTHLDGRSPVTPYPARRDWPLYTREVLRGVLLAEVAGRR
ncbi:MAG: metallophosphoesterase [Pseudonocardiaceae bacterium]